MTDPITTAVLQNRLAAIAEEMGEAMLRTAYSQILNSSRDFSTALCDPKGRLIAQAEHVPIHVGALPWAVRAVADAFATPKAPALASSLALTPATAATAENTASSTSSPGASSATCAVPGY